MGRFGLGKSIIIRYNIIVSFLVSNSLKRIQLEGLELEELEFDWLWNDQSKNCLYIKMKWILYKPARNELKVLNIIRLQLK